MHANERSEWCSLKLKLERGYYESKMSRLSVNQSNVFERDLPETSMICASKEANGASDASDASPSVWE